MGNGGKQHPLTVVETTGPKTVLQVFHNVVVYGKEQNTATGREELCRWQPALLSHSGAAAGATLLLPQALLDDRAQFERSDLVVLNDYNRAEQAGALVPLHEEVGVSGVSLLQLGSRTVDYEIFQLRRGASGLELHLAYSRHAACIGAPHRGDYQVARLEPERPVRVTINGKLDFSASGRRARSYLVRDYLFLLLGQFSRFEMRPPDAPCTLKTLPLADARHVDLREILY